MVRLLLTLIFLISNLCFADYVAPPYPISLGGTGQATQQAAIDALMGGSSTTGYVARYSGSHWVAAALQAGDVPTLNQSTTGNAATATALASTPSQCASGTWATGIAASGNANCSNPSTAYGAVVDMGNTAYAIQATDAHVRSTTTLTADRAATLPSCTSSNIGEKHEIKNLPSQTHNIILTASGSDLIDGNATITILPGGSKPVICGAFSSVGTWDVE